MSTGSSLSRRSIFGATGFGGAAGAGSGEAVSLASRSEAEGPGPPSGIGSGGAEAPAPAGFAGATGSGLSVPVFVNHDPCCPPPPRPGSTRPVWAGGGVLAPYFAGFFARSFSASADGAPPLSPIPAAPFALVTSFAIFCHGKRISTPSASSTSERKICGTRR